MFVFVSLFVCFLCRSCSSISLRECLRLRPWENRNAAEEGGGTGVVGGGGGRSGGSISGTNQSSSKFRTIKLMFTAPGGEVQAQRQHNNTTPHDTHRDKAMANGSELWAGHLRCVGGASLRRGKAVSSLVFFLFRVLMLYLCHSTVAA